MEKQALKDLIYGSLSEIIKNPQYHTLWVLEKPFTAEGEKALIEFFSVISKVMIKIDQEELDRRSKDLVMNALKEQKD